jgi:hypothetical protein
VACERVKPTVQETSAMNYQSTLCNVPGTQSSHLQSGDSLITVTVVMLQACHLCSSLKGLRAFLLMEEERSEFSKTSPLLGNYIGRDDCQCRYIRRHSLMYFLLRQAKKKSYGEVVVNTECIRGTRWRSSLRHCATNRKIASSIPDGVTVIFH